MEAATAEDVRLGSTPDPGAAAATKVAKDAPEANKDGKLEPAVEKTVVDATSWLLQAFDEREEVPAKPVDLNVGTSADPRWITWTIRSVPGPTLRAIRARAADQLGQNRGRNASLEDTNTAARANAEIIVEGTVEPNLRQVAAGRGLADPTVLVEEAFKHKPGLIDQLSAAVMELSGYDDSAMRDHMEVTAAGNSPG
jgi:hypothetical protein